MNKLTPFITLILHWSDTSLHSKPEYSLDNYLDLISFHHPDITGTTCVNATFSRQLKTWFNGNWSYSTAFYPGESRFASVFEHRIREAMGLQPENGGKFQITSYPPGIGIWKDSNLKLRKFETSCNTFSIAIFKIISWANTKTKRISAVLSILR